MKRTYEKPVLVKRTALKPAADTCFASRCVCQTLN